MHMDYELSLCSIFLVVCLSVQKSHVCHKETVQQDRSQGIDRDSQNICHGRVQKRRCVWRMMPRMGSDMREGVWFDEGVVWCSTWYKRSFSFLSESEILRLLCRYFYRLTTIARMKSLAREKPSWESLRPEMISPAWSETGARRRS